ncbi:hypothetical protein A4G21_10300 [Brucella intermedia]|nr:hypothetical protein A4G21_10300 [Brucella intermedia]
MRKLIAAVLFGSFMSFGVDAEARAVTKLEWNYCESIAELGARFMGMRYDNKLKKLDEMKFESDDPFVDKWQRVMATDIWSKSPEYFSQDTRDLMIPIFKDDWKRRCVNDFAERER